jgi:arylsulfatase A-like enzyme
MSDNGSINGNRPLSCGKGSPREGGIREPMVVKWPGVTKPGAAWDDYLIIEDFFPTILEMAGTKPAKPVDGVSFVPMIKGETGNARTRPLFWHTPNNWGPQNLGYGPCSAVRLGDWKYIFYHNPGQKIREELFNIREDIGETKNLVTANPEKRKELSATLKQYLKTVNAQIPTDKKTGKLIEIP